MIKTVVIIENEQPICDHLQDVFENNGWQVYKAYDLVGALNILDQVNYVELILLDIMMEVIPGTKATAKNAGIVAVDEFHKLYENKKKSLPPIVAFTAVTEVIPEARKHRFIRAVIDKNNMDWEADLIEEASKVA